MSPQFLSQVENGRKFINHQTIDKIFKALGINFNWEIDPFEELPLLFNTYIHTYVSIDKENRIKYSRMILEDNKWKYSFYYPIVLLTEFCSCVLEDSEGNIEDLMEKIEELFVFFSNSQKAIYNYFKGLHYHIDHDSYSKGEKYYLDSLQDSTTEEISGMVYYQLGQIKLTQISILESFEYINNAKTILAQYNDFKRLVWCESTLGEIYLYDKSSNKMEQQFLKDILLAQDYGDQNDIDILQCNLAYGLMITKQYKKAIHYATKLLGDTSFTMNLYYILAWSHFQLNQIKDCKYYLQLIKESNEELSEEAKTYVTCIHYLIKSNFKSYYKKLVRYYNSIKNRNRRFDTMIVLERLIDYCKEHQMYEEGFHYQQEYIQLTIYHSFED